MKRVAIIHFQPLEYYPPITNFLDIVCEEKSLILKVYTSTNTKNRKPYKNNKLRTIFRSQFPKYSDKKFIRILKYIKFNFLCLLRLLIFQPNEIIYFESFSAGPVYWYLRIFGKETVLKIHYHEYTNEDWYENGMKMVKIFHNYEKRFLYHKASWISHTNSDRVKLFLRDNMNVDSRKMKILPNYPPVSWQGTNKVRNPKSANSEILRTVYVGTLSIEYTYIVEYCDWVINQNGNVLLDIYCYNLSESTRTYLVNLNSKYINYIENGINYQDIPNILNQYDVGLILYKGLTKNFIYNAPNKLFEYLASGIDIWFSDRMKGCYPYIQNKDPRIISVNFNNLDNEEFKNRQDVSHTIKREDYTAEKALSPLIKDLLN